jgi:predicted secreted protein
MLLPPHALLSGAILVLVVYAAGHAGMYLSQDRPLVHPDGGENIQPVCQLTPAEGTTIVLDEMDGDQMCSIPRNTEFVIILPETPADGYSWNTAISPGLSILNTQYVADPYSPRFDLNGTHIWTLQAKDSGLQEFNASSAQGGSPGTPVMDTYTVRLLVRPES